MRSLNSANLSGFDVVDWSSLRTCTCTIAAPASYAACVDSTCSLTVIGTAGLFSFRGTDPVIATVMMQGPGPFCIGYVYPIFSDDKDINAGIEEVLGSRKAAGGPRFAISAPLRSPREKTGQRRLELISVVRSLWMYSDVHLQRGHCHDTTSWYRCVCGVSRAGRNGRRHAGAGGRSACGDCGTVREVEERALQLGTLGQRR